MYRLNVEGQIGVGERCIDTAGDGITLIYCPVQPTGPWQLLDVSIIIGYQHGSLVIQVTAHLGMGMGMGGVGEGVGEGVLSKIFVSELVHFISRRVEGPGREILQCPPSAVCLSVRPV